MAPGAYRILRSTEYFWACLRLVDLVDLEPIHAFWRREREREKERERERKRQTGGFASPTPVEEEEEEEETDRESTRCSAIEAGV